MASGDASLLGMIYDSLAITTVSAEEQTTASNYINNHLTASYEFISIRINYLFMYVTNYTYLANALHNLPARKSTNI